MMVILLLFLRRRLLLIFENLLVMIEQRIEDDLKRVHAELKLSLHSIDELQFDVLPVDVAQRDQCPRVVVRRVDDAHDFLHVGRLHDDGRQGQ